MVKRQVWALVTGTIRNEFYLRTVLVKLCNMRMKGEIEGIVYSTWDDEIDKVYNFRNELNELGIILVETPCVDEDLENKISGAVYERQRINISEGLNKIPNGSFVLKLRSDFLKGIRLLFDGFKNGGFDLRVKSFGLFPKMFYYKMTIEWYSFFQFFYCNDRFFYGWKEDLEKNFSSIRRLNLTRFHMFAEVLLLNGYNVQNTPILRKLWSILPSNFNDIIVYCSTKNDENLRLPRLLHRVFATMSVYIYTHINILSRQRDCTSEQLHIVDLFSDRLRTNSDIARVVEGDFAKSHDAEIFKDELRKIAMGIPDVCSYTEDEYLELKSFIKNELHNNMILEECPFTRALNARYVQKDAFEILLSRYSNEVQSILKNAEEDFDCMGDSIYLKIKNVKDKKTRLPFVKAAIFDRDINAIIEYLKILKDNDIEAFDEFTWRHATRNIRMHCNGYVLSEKAIFALYKVFELYFEIVNKHNIIRDTYPLLVRDFNNTGHSKTLNFKFPIVNYSINHVVLLDHLVKCLVEVVKTKKWSNKESCIVKVLLMIKPKSNPFPSEIISLMKDKNLVNETNEIANYYKESPFIIGDWVISDDVRILLQNSNLDKILSYEVEGEKNIEAVLKYLFSAYWDSPVYRSEISFAIEALTPKLTKSNFMSDLNCFLKKDNLTISKGNMVDDNNFIMLLETLYRKKCLQLNGQSVFEMCFDDRNRQMFLFTFLRIENDKRLDFFSMKNGYELWLYYTPYMQYEGSKILAVPVWENGQTWPGADRKNESSFAAYMRLWDGAVFISIELSAKDVVKAKELARAVGFEENNSLGSIIRLKTQRFLFKDEKDLSKAVNEALDEFCKVGEKVVEALDGFRHEKAPAM